MTPAGKASGSWRAIIDGLSHPDVWGPGGLYPLEWHEPPRAKVVRHT